MPQGMKILEAKEAVHKEWEKLEKLLAWQLVHSKEQKRGCGGDTKRGQNPLRLQSWYKIGLLYGCNHIRAKPKSPQGTRRSLRRFLELSEKPNVRLLTNPWNLAKLVKVFLKEQNAESRKELLQVVLQSGLDEKLWADSRDVVAICGTYKTFFGMGRHHLKGAVENHPEGP